eukprot:CAMPEP_0172932450 /NCGR_PEP_ID=MMETSP1075-20121228/220006_1 /TAXON_ID=2916 /ORGANISM="Ceratium fusus, Strain PA161109" /LENGTH=496 /DNA_ID=CAMNT_0013793777 /DNA_START=90 /DNA_END=1581 /DNA_ORIENTATION=-
MTWAPSCEENSKAFAVREQVVWLKEKLSAVAQRQKAQPIAAVPYHGIQQGTGQEEELLQRVQQLEAECLESSSQVEYLQAVYEHSQARVLELEETQRESAGTNDQAQAQVERIQQLEVSLGNSTMQVQGLQAALDESKAALNESVRLVHQLEGAHSDGKDQVQELEAKLAHLLEHAAQIPDLKAKIEEQSMLIPDMEAQGAAAAAHAARIRELEEKHVVYTRSISNLEEQAKEDAKNAEACHGDLKAKIASLEKSNSELQAALDLGKRRIVELEAEALQSSPSVEKSNSELQAALDLGKRRIVELEAEATANAASTSALNAEVAQLEKTIQALQSSPSVPIMDVGSLQVPAGLSSATSPDASIRRVAPVPVSPTGAGPTPVPVASPIRQIGVSPIQSRTTPVATRSAVRVPGPVLGARALAGEPKTAAALQPAMYAPHTGSSMRVVVPTAASTLSARTVQQQQERRNGNITQGRWETPHRYTNLQQPPPMLIRAVG